MLEGILQFIHNLSNLIGVTNPIGLIIVFGLVVLADVGFVIPFIIEPALFLITIQAGPLAPPAWLFVLMMTLGRQGGTAILYWLSRSAGDRMERLSRRFFPRLTNRFAARVQQFERKLGRQQHFALAIARLTPGLVQVSTIASGILRIHFYSVMFGAFLAGIIYDLVIVLLGSLAHYGLKGINADYSIYIALGLAVFMGLLSYIVGRVRRSKDQ
jgi:membrane protein DedA with SNARE-associated domain